MTVYYTAAAKRRKVRAWLSASQDMLTACGIVFGLVAFSLAPIWV